MKTRLMAVFFLVLLTLGTAYGEKAPGSVEVKETPYFLGLGFGFGENTPYVALEVKIFRFEQKDLSSGTPSPKAFRAILTFKDMDFPMKIIKPELSEFRADIMDNKPAGPDAPPVPIGHITFKVEKPDPRHDVAVGKLMIKTEDTEVSGQFSVYLHSLEIPDAKDKAPKESTLEGAK